MKELYHYGVKGMKWRQHRAKKDESESDKNIGPVGVSFSGNGVSYNPEQLGRQFARWVYQQNRVRAAGSTKKYQNKNKGRAKAAVNRNRAVSLRNARNANLVNRGKKVINISSSSNARAVNKVTRAER